MKKSIIILTIIALLPLRALVAGEGMWIPLLLSYNELEMRQMGMRITADDIYSINHSSLKDAIVKFGNGCTGEIVSDNGLLLTNHHCGYSWIQYHSSVEHDYLTNGFWAMNAEEELPCPGLTVTIMRRMENVTNIILEGVDELMSEKERSDMVKRNSNELRKMLEAESGYTVSIEAFYLGNEYYAIYNEIFKDVRFVGAPNSNIGKFGGDTDNWMWPRHTGDFSVFRVYADNEGKPADYSKDNKPYHPDYHLTISLKGVDEGDFSFVFGYPARTSEYLSSYAVNQDANVLNPIRIDLRTKILDVYNKYQEQDPAVRIQYASKHAGVANGWKKWIGATEGINSFKGVEKKQEFEKAFAAWAADKPQYKNILTEFEDNYNKLEKYYTAYTYMDEAGFSIEVIDFASQFSKLVNAANSEQIEKAVASLKTKSAAFFKDYYQPIDEEVAIAMLTSYRAAQPTDFRPEILNTIDKKYKGNIEKYVAQLFKKTMFASQDKVDELLDNYDAKKAKLIEKDPAYQAYMSIASFNNDNVYPELLRIMADNNALLRTYMRAQMEMQPEKNFYPDANFTLRVTYGKIGGFEPKDAMVYKHYTTLDGIMQKENPNIYDYVVEPKLKELYQAQDYGRYADKDGSMHVAFCASNHTTGGNSGSPILNADGHLIGLNFDRCWEGTMSDMMYDPDICRNISVDIRYVLFIIDKYAGASHLVEEMTIEQ